MSPLFDAHSHLHDGWLAPHRKQILTDLDKVGVRAVVVNGTSESDWPEVAAFCSATQSSALDSAPATPSPVRLLPSYGLHPWDAGNRTAAWLETLTTRLDSDAGAFVGEIGLDRWILERARPDDPRLAGLTRASLDEQLEVFLVQLALAAERNLPASLHCLDAFGALHEALRSYPLPARGFLLHAYSGPAELVPEFSKLGAYFSFNGSFLEHGKRRRRDVFAAIPIDRLLIETDAPAMRLPADRERFTLPPAPSGDALNHPANIAASYAGMAELREISIEHLATAVARNFSRLFGTAASGSETPPQSATAQTQNR